MTNPLFDDTIKSTEQLVGFAPDLTDYEVMMVGKIVGELQMRYGSKPNTSKNLDALRDEALYKLAKIGILAEVDPTPAFYGRPPIIEIRGKFSTDPIHKYGFDHERKRFEVIESKKRGEAYKGQKEGYNRRKDKKKK